MLRTIVGIIGIIILAVILAYFFVFKGGNPAPSKSQEIPLNINLQEIKPKEWKAITKEGLLKINIDGDKEVEWLLLYRDTGATNQIGGVIYDAQNRPRDVKSIAISQQTPAYLVPYRLLPDYTAKKSSGYLGDSSVSYKTIAVNSTKESDEKEKKTATDVMKGNILLISGFDNNRPNRFSAFKWAGPKSGYDGAVAYTPGWFSLSKTAPHDWFSWAKGKNTNAVLGDIYAWEPQVDRSNICRRVKWALDKKEFRYDADYDNSDLFFCSGKIPSEPTFPEAQVLAYLQDGKKGRLNKRETADGKREYPEIPPFKDASVRMINQPVITTDTTEVEVFVDFIADDVPYRMVWSVEMLKPQDATATVHWRIVDAYER